MAEGEQWVRKSKLRQSIGQILFALQFPVHADPYCSYSLVHDHPVIRRIVGHLQEPINLPDDEVGQPLWTYNTLEDVSPDSSHQGFLLGPTNRDMSFPGPAAFLGPEASQSPGSKPGRSCPPGPPASSPLVVVACLPARTSETTPSGRKNTTQSVPVHDRILTRTPSSSFCSSPRG